MQTIHAEALRHKGPPLLDRSDREAKTLGDLLYADMAKAPVFEKEWVPLVRSIAGGDQLALHELYMQTHRIVFTLIVRITRNRETAEELTLDVFHKSWWSSSCLARASRSFANPERIRALFRRERRRGMPQEVAQLSEIKYVLWVTGRSRGSLDYRLLC